MFVARSRLACPPELCTSEHASAGAAGGLALACHARRTSGRAEVEAFIQSIYAKRYGAHIRHWAPSLISLMAASAVVAAAGYRHASRPLFLERYLPESVDTLIARHAGATISRAAIFEVGHFAARNGCGRALMIALGQHLAARGCTWVVCTATRELRLLFGRMGLQPLVLGPASAGRLGAEAASWGTYYEHAPMVLAGSLVPGIAALERRA